MSILRVILLLFRALFRDRSRLALENLALRQQLAILRHKVVRPRLRHAERAFWVSLARAWDQWRSPLILVRPETVLRWHRQGFRYFWRWKSRGRPCVRPPIYPASPALSLDLFPTSGIMQLFKEPHDAAPQPPYPD